MKAEGAYRASDGEVVHRSSELYEPNGDCPHGNCCDGFTYVLGYIQHLLGVLPQDSPERDILLRVMDEVGK